MLSLSLLTKSLTKLLILFYSQLFFYQPDYKKVAETCNTWRNNGDSDDKWTSIEGIIDFYDLDLGNFSGNAGPGTYYNNFVIFYY